RRLGAVSVALAIGHTPYARWVLHENRDCRDHRPTQCGEVYVTEWTSQGEDRDSLGQATDDPDAHPRRGASPGCASGVSGYPRAASPATPPQQAHGANRVGRDAGRRPPLRHGRGDRPAWSWRSRCPGSGTIDDESGEQARVSPDQQGGPCEQGPGLANHRDILPDAGLDG